MPRLAVSGRHILVRKPQWVTRLAPPTRWAFFSSLRSRSTLSITSSTWLSGRSLRLNTFASLRVDEVVIEVEPDRGLEVVVVDVHLHPLQAVPAEDVVGVPAGGQVQEEAVADAQELRRQFVAGDGDHRDIAQLLVVVLQP